MVPIRSLPHGTRRFVPNDGSGTVLNPHRELITRLYQFEKKPLKEVMIFIDEEFGLSPSFVSLQ
jgi:Clr5 domain